MTTDPIEKWRSPVATYDAGGMHWTLALRVFIEIAEPRLVAGMLSATGPALLAKLREWADDFPRHGAVRTGDGEMHERRLRAILDAAQPWFDSHPSG